MKGNIFCDRSVITPIFIKRCIRQKYFFYTLTITEATAS